MDTIVRRNTNGGSLMNSAELALMTGDVRHILPWVPEESENTMKNLLERACCERTVNEGRRSLTADWYFRKVLHLHAALYGQENIDLSTKTPEEKKIILLVEKACKSGNFEEITAVIPDTPAGQMRDRFRDVMSKRNNREKNRSAGRAYVLALAGFIALAKNLQAGSIRALEK